MSTTRYWHGGTLIRGDMIHPQPNEGTRSGDPDGWVYVTTDRSLAVMYASTTVNPWVHEVRPIGTVEADPGSMLDTSFRCPRAEIIGREKPSRTEVMACRASFERAERMLDEVAR